MAWLLLILAGIFELGWPLGFKLASTYPKHFYLVYYTFCHFNGIKRVRIISGPKKYSYQYRIYRVDRYRIFRYIYHRHIILSRFCQYSQIIIRNTHTYRYRRIKDISLTDKYLLVITFCFIIN